MELRLKIAVGALAALAAGIGVVTAVPTSSNPAAGVTPAAVSYTTPVAGEQPRDKTGTGSDKRDSDKVREHSDNVRQEGAGEEGK